MTTFDQLPWLPWAIAAEVEPRLVPIFLRAQRLNRRARHRCRAHDWTALINDVLDLRMPPWAYDAAVDMLHATAGMPCPCADCVGHLADRRLLSRRRRDNRPLGLGTPRRASPSR